MGASSSIAHDGARAVLACSGDPHLATAPTEQEAAEVRRGSDRVVVDPAGIPQLLDDLLSVSIIGEACHLTVLLGTLARLTHHTNGLLEPGGGRPHAVTLDRL